MRTHTATKLIGAALALAAAMFTAGCAEDVVTIDLNSAAPRIVIEGKIAEGAGPHTVRLSKTTDFFTPANYPPVTGAVVTITDSTAGIVKTLAESEPGLYITNQLAGVVGNTYTLSVTAEGQEYRASSTMQTKGHIDSLAFEVDDADEESYIVHCHFSDTEDVDEYYYFKLFLNGEQRTEYATYQDRITDGNAIDGELWIGDDPIVDGDVLVVEMRTVDRPVHDYFWTLNNAATELSSGMIMLGGIPANPTSNLSGGALGYFSAYTADIDTLIVDMSKAIK